VKREVVGLRQLQLHLHAPNRISPEREAMTRRSVRQIAALRVPPQATNTPAIQGDPTTYELQTD
jgi:hypothetical protein